MCRGSPIRDASISRSSRGREECETNPNEENGRAEVACIGVDHVGGDDGDDGVPQPVGSRRETDTTGTDRKREDLACVWKNENKPQIRCTGKGKRMIGQK